ncbi:hypothetical protein P171DRAFT_32017 [Karstenula rhodostoma CBS 690.94]|uniref:BTB domain-containing protein n=1 Tax=Karstenula rhodostoma CBS 690.94 TaxID=1392251 RepID=A0A9P4UCI6_9PLEO|nr:hypothetical protein P171DRAFT_32017 [Karstenula rhodostoma CBS 690.94]
MHNLGSVLQLTEHRFSGPVIRVIVKYHAEQDDRVGEGKEIKPIEFWVPRDLLRHSSKFFQAATKPEWDALRDKSHTVTISFIEPELFQAYIHWLYLGTIPCTGGDNLDDESDHILLANLYVVGERLMDSKLKNDLLDTIANMADDYFPGAAAICTIYEGTPPESSARRLLTDLCVWGAHANDNSWPVEYDEYPREALLDILKAMTRLREISVPNDHSPWHKLQDYHEKVE